MIALIQRVSRAAAFENPVAGAPICSIGKGLLILAGFSPEDTQVSVEQMLIKIKSLRLFSDSAGKMNLSGGEVGASYLIVSQFTLYADCRYGNRPSFERAAPKALAKDLFLHCVDHARVLLGRERVQSSPFGADLAIELVNDGPVTLWLNSEEIL